MSLFRKYKSTLGLDLCSESIKLLELSKIGKRYRVENYGFYKFATPTMDHGLIHDRPAIIRGMQILLNQIKLGNKKTVLSLPDVYTVRKTIQVSQDLSELDLEELALIEIQKYIPHATHINFDFKLSESRVSSQLRDLLIIAAPSEFISQRVELLKQIGLRPQAIEVESHATERVLRHLNHANPFNNMLFAKHIDRQAIAHNTTQLITVCGLALRE